MDVYERIGTAFCWTAVAVIFSLVAVSSVSGAPAANRASDRADEAAPPGFGGWLQIVLPAEADDLTVVETLVDAGVEPAISRSSVTVKITTIDTVERVRSPRANDRLLNRDPRNDRFIRRVDALFDARWDGVPAQVVYVRNHTGDAVDWLTQYGSRIGAAGVGAEDVAAVDQSGALHRVESSDDPMWPAYVTAFAGLLSALAALSLAVFGVRRDRESLRVTAVGVWSRLFSRGRDAFFVPVLCCAIVAILAASVASGTGARIASEVRHPRIEVPAPEGRHTTADSAGMPDLTGNTELTSSDARRLYSRARADWERDPEPEIPHFGSVLAHVAYQHALAWGRDYKPPRYDERVFRPTSDHSAVGRTDVEEDTVIHFNDRWLASAIGPDGLPVARLLAQSAGRAPITLREVEREPPRPGRLRGLIVSVAMIGGAAIALSAVTRLQVH